MTIINYISMRKFISYRIHDFIADKLQWGISIFSVVSFALHHYQFCDSGHLVEPLIRMVYCLLIPFVVFFCGRKSIKYIFLVFALTVELFAQFHNYTAFIICLFFVALKPKSRNITFSLYFVDALITCTLHDKSAIHLTIHFMNCAFLWFVFQYIIEHARNLFKKEYSKLNLDDKERFILAQLADGAKQKEIDGYSENTVSKKLKLMREKNFCKTNEELIMRYIAEIQ